MERREAVITGVLLGAMFAVIAGLFAYGRSQETTLPLNDEPVVSTTDTPDLDDTPIEFDAFVAEAVAFVEATRGRRFVATPTVLSLSEAAFVARIQADFAEDFDESPEDVELFNAMYRAIGLIEPDDSIDDVYGQFGEAGILGFYDPETDELVVRQRDELSLLTMSTIVHELTHAFDDQHFDLDRPEYDDRTDEIAWGFRAVAEGSASWVEEEWKATLSLDQQLQLQQEEFGFADPGIFDRFELSYLLLELSPYDYGRSFVEHLQAGGGNDALNEAIEEPPVTSEQVIDPTRYDVREGAIELAPPPADGEIQFSGIGGQVLIDSIFQGNGVFRDFEWGGDQIVVWTAEGRSCLRWDVQAEDGGTGAVANNFGQWGDNVGSTVVEILDDRTVRIERCV